LRKNHARAVRLPAPRPPSGKGNCYDNAMMETVFKTIKSEMI
jgi:transposase InsO family protein